jgi:hypothetical protein
LWEEEEERGKGGGGDRGCVPDDVADRLADEDHSVGEGAFGVACGVLRR